MEEKIMTEIQEVSYLMFLLGIVLEYEFDDLKNFDKKTTVTVLTGAIKDKIDTFIKTREKIVMFSKHRAQH